MPIYEYLCQSCRRRVSIFHRSLAAAASAVCPHCGGTQLQRLLSTFAIMRSEESRFEAAAAEAEQWGDFDENDPRKMAAWARRMKAELGEEAGPEFDEVIDRMEAGEGLEDQGNAGEEEGLSDLGDDW